MLAIGSMSCLKSCALLYAFGSKIAGGISLRPLLGCPTFTRLGSGGGFIRFKLSRAVF